MIIGIDIGCSTTKIVGIENGTIHTPMLVRATDPIASLFGAFGKFIDTNSLSLSDIEKIITTGVGSSYVSKPIYGLPTGKTDEFLANGLGGKYLSSLDNIIIVSMGTGTALVRASGDRIEHIGGIGIGGGTIIGLADLLLNTQDIKTVIEMAKGGELSHIDLMIQDISKEALPGLPLYATASNFGKISDLASKEDIALGIINMVLQVIGKAAILASQGNGIKDIVLIGNLTGIPQCRPIMGILENMFDVNFVIPEHANFATAVGAALTYSEQKDYRNVL